METIQDVTYVRVFSKKLITKMVPVLFKQLIIMWVINPNTDYSKYYGYTVRVTYIDGYSSNETHFEAILTNIIVNAQNLVSIILDRQILHSYEKYVYTSKHTVCPNIISKLEVLIPDLKKTIETDLTQHKCGYDESTIILGFLDNYIEI